MNRPRTITNGDALRYLPPVFCVYAYKDGYGGLFENRRDTKKAFRNPDVLYMVRVRMKHGTA